MNTQKQSLHQQSAEKLKALLYQKTAELDLKNRELEVEAALECVRSRSMAMHESSELQEVIGVVFNQLLQLGLQMDTAQIDIYEKGSEELNVWVANELQPYGRRINIPHFDRPMILDYLKARNEGLAEFSATYSKEDKNSFYAIAFKNSDLKDVPEERKEKMLEGAGLGIYAAFVGQTSIQLLNFVGKEYDVEECRIVRRFTEVFQQTYTRFLDLQKAEAQAREALIEASLERVRSRTMAMHSSGELREVVFTIFKELSASVEMCIILMFNEQLDEIEWWSTGLVTDKLPQSYRIPLSREIKKNELIKRYINSLKKGISYEVAILSGETKRDWDKYIFEQTGLKKMPAKTKRAMMSYESVHQSDAFMKNGVIEVTGLEHLNEEKADILKRFAKVVEQTYTRFLDLQNAEAQTQEARTQTALERIRASAMAMHSSDGLSKVAAVLREQMSLLGQKELESCIVQLYEKGSENYSAYYSFKMPDDPDENMVHDVATVPWRETEWSRKMIEQFTSGVDNFIIHADHSMLKEWYEMLAIVSPRTVELNSKGELIVPDELYYYFSCFSGGLLSVISYGAPTHETKELLNRSSMAFDMAFRRYIDLQNAEAQAREAQIEAALERVRARAMGLHKSDELKEVIAILYNQLKQLGIELYDANIVIQDNSTNALNFWGSGLGGVEMPPKITIPYLDRAVLKKLYYECDSLEKYRAFELKGKELKNYHKIIMTETEFKDAPKEYQEEMLSVNRIVLSYVSIEHGWLEVAGDAFLSKDHAEILQRFGSVVDLTYTRFADLQKAEAQTQEARTQTALERIRASAMAMHSSADLFDVSNVLRDQMGKLGQPGLDSSGIHFYDDSRGKIKVWWAYGEFDNPSVEYITGFSEIDYDSCQYIREVVDHYHSRQEQFIIHSRKTKLVEWYGVMVKVASEIIEYNESGQLIVPNELHYCYSRFPGGALTMASEKPFSQEAMKLQKRATQVFELAYRRFLDLQKAEAQAREAQIEAALERIRSKALAMQSSSDLLEVSIVLREQMGNLGQEELESSIIHLYNNTETLEAWYTFRSTETNSTKIVTDKAIIPMNSCDYIHETIEKYNSKETEYTIVSDGKKLADWYNVMVKVAPDTIEYDGDGKMIVPDILYYHHSKFSGGALLMISNEKPSDEAKELQKRAAKVFNLAYQRFSDLQQAEAQAREAQIEAALERIRAKALSMQLSSDLIDVSNVLRDQMGLLGQEELEASVVHLYQENADTFEGWYAFRPPNDPSGKIVTGTAFVPVDTSEWAREVISIYKSSKTEYTIVSSGDKLKEWYGVLATVAPNTLEYSMDGEMLVPDIIFYHFSNFSGGSLLMTSNQKPSDEAKELQRRAARVFNLAYQRFLDLKQAEARVKETVKQASLDRVRGEIASMRTKDDLSRITPLIWHELTTLTVPFIRCGVFIMDEESKIIQSHLSSPDGKSLGLLNLPYEADNIGNNAVKYWRKGKIYKDHWNEDQFLKFMQKMVKLGRLDNPELYQGAAKPPESLDLHFVPFKQGMLYVGNTAPLSQEELQLVQSLAEAFSIAYARYEDFTQLEEAKNQTEQTLDDLKSTQTQLIHAEKMASLGELTAGIAHEIQNPLNFVNNFAEVSADLIEEMHEEMESGNTAEVEAITNDLKENLQKINHHGNRASSIVKGMLEHSRSSDKKKILTDINVLADEYLRLAYHGLRAKDKSFNSDFKTDLDESMPKINVIPREIGRVLLNLINNAFYAVSIKSKEGIQNYIPQVILKTKLNDKIIEISVKDNGNGIQKDAIDKIFQPFFTTKPTGQGTGLGLSLSYDIITKGHDGQLEVETWEGEGTEFIIILPNI